MIRQTLLPFKMETTNDLITSHAGLALLGEFAVALGLPRLLDEQLPSPGSGSGYCVSGHVMPLVLMLNGGGRSLEDLRGIRSDCGLRELLALDRIPSSDATGDWFRRSFGNGGLEGLAAVNRTILARGLRDDGLLSYTLAMDATGIEAWKESARMTYKGYRGYMPMVGHIAENGLVVGDEFRHGNESPSVRNLSFLKYCERQLPTGKRIGALRADSAAYQAGIIDYCDDNEIAYAIGADLDRSVVEQIAHIEAGDWHDYQDGQIATDRALHEQELLLFSSDRSSPSLPG